MIRFTAKFLGLFCLALFISSCAKVQVSLDYNPKTTEEFIGSITIKDFGYFPQEGIAQNEIRETAVGRIFLTEDVGKYFSNALRREFRQAGLSLKGKKACSLEGEVNEFLMDSLGYSTDYVTDVRYILFDNSGSALLDNNYRVEFNASKFIDPSIVLNNINKAVSDNINQLMADPIFSESVDQHCVT